MIIAGVFYLSVSIPGSIAPVHPTPHPMQCPTYSITPSVLLPPVHTMLTTIAHCYYYSIAPWYSTYTPTVLHTIVPCVSLPYTITPYHLHESQWYYPSQHLLYRHSTIQLHCIQYTLAASSPPTTAAQHLSISPYTMIPTTSTSTYYMYCTTSTSTLRAPLASYLPMYITTASCYHDSQYYIDAQHLPTCPVPT